jgi:hypothetical protein
MVLNEPLNDSETRAKAEGIKYGLTQETIEVLIDRMSGMTDTSTRYEMPVSPAARGLAAAAAQLLRRRSERIAPSNAPCSGCGSVGRPRSRPEAVPTCRLGRPGSRRQKPD